MKLKVLFAAFILTILGALSLFQFNTVAVLAAVCNNPITAPITAPLCNNPVTSPITSPYLITADSSQTIFDGSSPVILSIPSSINNHTVSFASLLDISGQRASVVLGNSLSLVAATSLGDVDVQLPGSIMISGPSSWNGVINSPTILSSSAVSIPDNGAKPTGVVEVGAGDTSLTFDKAVRILIPSQSGKLAGYQIGSNFNKITQICSADSQTAGDNLPAGGDCYINVGSDLVIWTKHFTKFVTYTENSNGSSSSATSSSDSNQVQTCSDIKPKSVPQIVSAVSSEPNQVTIIWSKAADPVTYYLIAYGTKSGQVEYGNPNVGDKNTTSYIVKDLSGGQSYFFRVKAVNNCMPGDFSPEVKVVVAGPKLTAPAAAGFQKGVLSAQKEASLSAEDNSGFRPITSAQPARVVNETAGIFGRIWNFIKRIFSH